MGAPEGTGRSREPVIVEHWTGMETTIGIVLLVATVVPVIVVAVAFLWAARKDGEEDRELQRRLGIRRRTRLGR
jgi:hypothetical protein